MRIFSDNAASIKPSFQQQICWISNQNSFDSSNLQLPPGGRIYFSIDINTQPRAKYQFIPNTPLPTNPEEVWGFHSVIRMKRPTRSEARSAEPMNGKLLVAERSDATSGKSPVAERRRSGNLILSSMCRVRHKVRH